MVERTHGTGIKMKKIENQKSQRGNALAFTLVELLVVISIIGVLAAFTIPVLKSVKSTQYRKTVRGELEFIQTALENYKARYGFYPPSNQKASGVNYNPWLLPQLYYELSGTTNDGVNFVTLDGSVSIPVNSSGKDVKSTYGVDGFINCTKGGSGEDDARAKNFLPGIRQKQIYSGWTNTMGGSATTILITSVGGPDDSYHPLDTVYGTGPNPIRYRYPGIKNPGSYDLWVQLSINGKNHLICNWTRQVLINDTSVP
jgi:prepilin-type N-terminal cleavage/methylation domain-containing protein